MVLSGTFLVTTDLAPTITLLPIVIFGNMVAFEPILQKSPIIQFPEI
jgi:hypothetical protein